MGCHRIGWLSCDEPVGEIWLTILQKMRARISKSFFTRGICKRRASFCGVPQTQIPSKVPSVSSSWKQGWGRLFRQDLVGERGQVTSPWRRAFWNGRSTSSDLILQHRYPVCCWACVYMKRGSFRWVKSRSQWWLAPSEGPDGHSFALKWRRVQGFNYSVLYAFSFKYRLLNSGFLMNDWLFTVVYNQKFEYFQTSSQDTARKIFHLVLSYAFY